MATITAAEYWQEVRDLAKSAVEEVKSACEDNHDHAEERLSDQLNETINGHSWVIYTHSAQQVLVHSPNDGYAVEEWGADTVVDHGSLNWSALAFGALYADVQEEVSHLVNYGTSDLGLWDNELDERERHRGYVVQVQR